LPWVWACDPSLLIADEPTTALDVTIQAQILDLLRRLQRDRGMSIILITHDLGVVAETCDRVQVMYAGRIVERATTRQLFTAPQHPYTIGLLNSMPRGTTRRGELQAIRGTVPDVREKPLGCSFHPRCDRAWDLCRRVEPPAYTTEAGREVRCHLYE
jgi:peptide/nickel transport system ATP-binding protein